MVPVNSFKGYLDEPYNRAKIYPGNTLSGTDKSRTGIELNDGPLFHF